MPKNAKVCKGVNDFTTVNNRYVKRSKMKKRSGHKKALVCAQLDVHCMPAGLVQTAIPVMLNYNLVNSDNS